MTISKVQYTSRKLAEQLRGFALHGGHFDYRPDHAGKPNSTRCSATCCALPSTMRCRPTNSCQRLPGLFDHHMAARISTFIGELHAAPFGISLMVHCEYGISRSAAVALFAFGTDRRPAGSPRVHLRSQPVGDRPAGSTPSGLSVDVPQPLMSQDRRQARRA